jgi:hypothetical protein
MGNQVNQGHKRNNSNPNVQPMIDGIKQLDLNAYNSNKINHEHYHNNDITRINFEQQQKNYIYYIKYSDLIAAFRHYSPNDQMTLDKFNECINALLRFDIIPIIPYTYMSDKLFKLLDKVCDYY